MAKVKVDIKHPSGEVELGHSVEIAQYSRRTIPEQVEDHLRLKHTRKGIRGGWTYEFSKPAPAVQVPAVPEKKGA